MSLRQLTLTLLLALLACTSAAQAPGDLATYTGPDRLERLVAAAKKEGSVTLYTSMNEKDVHALAAAFEKRYGIRTTVWRSGKNKVLQRAIAESQAGRREVDLVHNPAPEMEALHNERLLLRTTSPAARELIAGIAPAHGEWLPLRIYVFVQAYNTNAVRAAEVPRRWEDLLDARWKGRLGIEAKEQEWFATFVRQDERHLELLRTLVARNGLSVRAGNSLLLNMVISGEVPLAITMYSYLVEQAKQKGAPVDYVALKPTLAYTDGVGVMKHAPHPNAALLFQEFLLTDGERMMKEQKQLTAHRQDEATVNAFAPIYIDPAKVLVDYDKWTQVFEDTVQGRAPRTQAAR